MYDGLNKSSLYVKNITSVGLNKSLQHVKIRQTLTRRFSGIFSKNRYLEKKNLIYRFSLCAILILFGVASVFKFEMVSW